jgi:hypothetical protein
VCEAPTMNFIVLGLSRAERRKGEMRGECGLYIGTGWGETAGVQSGIEEEEVTGAPLLVCLTRGRRRPCAD